MHTRSCKHCLHATIFRRRQSGTARLPNSRLPVEYSTARQPSHPGTAARYSKSVWMKVRKFHRCLSSPWFLKTAFRAWKSLGAIVSAAVNSQGTPACRFGADVTRQTRNHGQTVTARISCRQSQHRELQVRRRLGHRPRRLRNLYWRLLSNPRLFPPQ